MSLRLLFRQVLHVVSPEDPEVSIGGVAPNVMIYLAVLSLEPLFSPGGDVVLPRGLDVL